MKKRKLLLFISVSYFLLFYCEDKKESLEVKKESYIYSYEQSIKKVAPIKYFDIEQASESLKNKYVIFNDSGFVDCDAPPNSKYYHFISSPFDDSCIWAMHFAGSGLSYEFNPDDMVWTGLEKKFSNFSRGLTAKLVVKDTYDRDLIWIGNSSVGLLLYSKKSGNYKIFQRNEYLDNALITDIEPGKDFVWIGTASKCYAFSRSDQEISCISEEIKRSEEIHIEADGTILMNNSNYSDYESYRYDPVTKTVKKISEIEGFSFDEKKRPSHERKIVTRDEFKIFNDKRSTIIIDPDKKIHTIPGTLNLHNIVIDKKNLWFFGIGYVFNRYGEVFIKFKSDSDVIEEYYLRNYSISRVYDDNDAIWFLPVKRGNGGINKIILGKIVKKTNDIYVLMIDPLSNFAKEIEKHQDDRDIFCDSKNIWLKMNGKLYKAAKSAIDTSMMHFDRVKELEILQEDEIRWKKYVNIEDKSNELISEYLQNKTAEIENIEQRLKNDKFSKTFPPRSTIEKRDLEIRLERLQRSLITGGLLKNMANYSNDVLRKLIPLIAEYNPENAIPYLRELFYQKNTPLLEIDLHDLQSRSKNMGEIIINALYALGDREFIRKNCSKEWEMLTSQLLEILKTNTKPYSELPEQAQHFLTRLTYLCGFDFLADHLSESAIALTDNKIIPLSYSGFQLDDRLSAKDVVKVIWKKEPRRYNQSEILVLRNNIIGWVFESTLHIGPFPSQKELVEDINSLWDKRKYIDMIKPLQLIGLFETDKNICEQLAVPLDMIPFLQNLKLVDVINYHGEPYHIIDLSSLDIEQLDNSNEMEIGLHYSHSYWESSRDELLIFKYNNQNKIFENIKEISLGSIDMGIACYSSYYYWDIKQDGNKEIVQFEWTNLENDSVCYLNGLYFYDDHQGKLDQFLINEQLENYLLTKFDKPNNEAERKMIDYLHHGIAPFQPHLLRIFSLSNQDFINELEEKGNKLSVKLIINDTYYEDLTWAVINNKVVLFQKQSKEYKMFEPDDFEHNIIRSIVPGKDYCWIVAEQYSSKFYCYKYSRETKNVTKMIDKNMINGTIYIDTDETIIFDSGKYRYIPEKDTVESSTSQWNIAIDFDNDIKDFTIIQGYKIIRFNNDTTMIIDSNGNRYNTTLNINLDNSKFDQNAIWFISDSKDGLIKFTMKNGIFTEYQLPSSEIHAIDADDGVLWLAQTEPEKKLINLGLFNSKTEEAFLFNPSLFSMGRYKPESSSLSHDKEYVWLYLGDFQYHIIIYRGQGFRFDKKKIFRQLTEKNSNKKTIE